MASGTDAGIDRVLWTEAEIAARVAEVAAELSADLRRLREPAVVVGVATGAFLFLADLVRRVDALLEVDVVRAESYGDGTESSGRPRVTSDLKVDVAAKHVVVVEDIVDTGNTVSCLIAHLQKKGASSISVCTFLDKPARRKVNFQLVGDGKFYRGFEIPTLSTIPLHSSKKTQKPCKKRKLKLKKVTTTTASLVAAMDSSRRTRSRFPSQLPVAN